MGPYVPGVCLLPSVVELDVRRMQVSSFLRSVLAVITLVGGLVGDGRAGIAADLRHYFLYAQ